MSVWDTLSTAPNHSPGWYYTNGTFSISLCSLIDYQAFETHSTFTLLTQTSFPQHVMVFSAFPLIPLCQGQKVSAGGGWSLLLPLLESTVITKTSFMLSPLLRSPVNTLLAGFFWGLWCMCMHSQWPFFTLYCGRGVSAAASMVFQRNSCKELAWGRTPRGMKGRHRISEACVVHNLAGRGIEQLGYNKIITVQSYSVEIRKNFNDFCRRYQAIVNQSARLSETADFAYVGLLCLEAPGQLHDTVWLKGEINLSISILISIQLPYYSVMWGICMVLPKGFAFPNSKYLTHCLGRTVLLLNCSQCKLL